MSLKEILCQDKAINGLQTAYFADKTAQSYIFAGPQGTGKFTTAKAWEKMLLCKKPVIEENGDDNFIDSCQQCPSCRLIDTDSHPDFAYIFV